MSDRDLLLPRLVCDDRGELVFVVAAADAAGAAVLTDRLRHQLAAAGDAGQSRLEFTIDAAPLAFPSLSSRSANIWRMR